MRICIDIDGVLSELRQPNQNYADLEPVAGAAEMLQSMKEAGHTVILFTARHMKTCSGNVGMVVARQGKVTLDWLEKHEIPFDEIHFGKPHADVYIDDNAYRFTSWQELGPAGQGLPNSTEKQLAELKS